MNTRPVTGDTVRLKIGGPLMTVLSVSPEACCCMWFAPPGAKFQHGSFEPEVVELVQRGSRLLQSWDYGPGPHT